jgi:hypothetical protein
MLKLLVALADQQMLIDFAILAGVNGAFNALAMWGSATNLKECVLLPITTVEYATHVLRLSANRQGKALKVLHVPQDAKLMLVRSVAVATTRVHAWNPHLTVMIMLHEKLFRADAFIFDCHPSLPDKRLFAVSRMNKSIVEIEVENGRAADLQLDQEWTFCRDMAALDPAAHEMVLQFLAIVIAADGRIAAQEQFLMELGLMSCIPARKPDNVKVGLRQLASALKSGGAFQQETLRRCTDPSPNAPARDGYSAGIKSSCASVIQWASRQLKR